MPSKNMSLILALAIINVVRYVIVCISSSTIVIYRSIARNKVRLVDKGYISIDYDETLPFLKKDPFSYCLIWLDIEAMTVSNAFFKVF